MTARGSHGEASNMFAFRSVCCETFSNSCCGGETECSEESVRTDMITSREALEIVKRRARCAVVNKFSVANILSSQDALDFILCSDSHAAEWHIRFKRLRDYDFCHVRFFLLQNQQNVGNSTLIHPTLSRVCDAHRSCAGQFSARQLDVMCLPSSGRLSHHRDTQIPQ